MTAATTPEGLPPDVLDKLRRSVPLRMGAMGDLTIGGDPVTHPRVLAALRAGLDADEQGEPTVRIGAHWCYLTVDDCPLRATAVMAAGDGLDVRLDDGRTVPLPPSTLWDQPGRGLRFCTPSATSGRPLAVRFTNRAQMDLAPWLLLEDDGTATLTLGGARYRVCSDAVGPDGSPCATPT